MTTASNEGNTPAGVEDQADVNQGGTVQGVVNGIDVTGLNQAIQTVAAQPGAQKAPKASRVRWLGGLKLRAFVRNHAFMIDEPTHLTGEDVAPNAMEYVIGALGACYATGFIMNASKRGIEVDNLEVVLDGSQVNVFTFLGVSDDGHPGFETIKAKLFVQSSADEATLKEIWEHTLKTSPVGNSLIHSVKIEPEIQVV